MKTLFQTSISGRVPSLPEKRFLINFLFVSALFAVALFVSAADEIDTDSHYHPVITEFRQLIESDPVVRMYLTEMIDQVPEKNRNIADVHDFLDQLNEIITTAPGYHSNPRSTLPLTTLLVHTMSTPAGLAACRNEKINAMIRKVLLAWAAFLNSPESLYVLNDSPGGWKSEEATARLKMNDYLYDPDDPHWGFRSWNEFFTRKLAPGTRPIAEPDNGKVIVSVCDSVVYDLKSDVKKTNNFWIKSQPYSLADMLANDEYTDQFVGGTVFQSFLSVFDYHRYHSPVAGTVRKVYKVNGLYFSKVKASQQDRTAQYNSQRYISHVQTRALIFIDADDPAIGLVCFMPVGMVEVSSCTINPEIQPGYHVKKGEELGCFQFGGSTTCLIFRPGVIKEFTVQKKDFCKVGERIAIAH